MMSRFSQLLMPSTLLKYLLRHSSSIMASQILLLLIEATYLLQSSGHPFVIILALTIDLILLFIFK